MSCIKSSKPGKITREKVLIGLTREFIEIMAGAENSSPCPRQDDDLDVLAGSKFRKVGTQFGDKIQ